MVVSKLKALGFPSPAPHKLNVAAHACYLNIPKTEGTQKMCRTTQEAGSSRTTLDPEEDDLEMRVQCWGPGAQKSSPRRSQGRVDTLLMTTSERSLLKGRWQKDGLLKCVLMSLMF